MSQPFVIWWEPAKLHGYMQLACQVSCFLGPSSIPHPVLSCLPTHLYTHFQICFTTPYLFDHQTWLQRWSPWNIIKSKPKPHKNLQSQSQLKITKLKPTQGQTTPVITSHLECEIFRCCKSLWFLSLWNYFLSLYCSFYLHIYNSFLYCKVHPKYLIPSGK